MTRQDIIDRVYAIAVRQQFSQILSELIVEELEAIEKEIKAEMEPADAHPKR